MPLDFRLLGQPVNALEALQAYGAAQQMRQQQMERERKEEERQVEQRRLARLQAGLGASINRETGAVDPVAARGAYLDAGDATGAMKFETARSEQQAAQIKAMTERREVGLRLLQQAKDPQSYAWARERAKEYGFDISTIPEQYDAAFVERARAELMALDPQKASAPPSAVQTLQAMGIDPQSEEGRAILTDHLNPPAYQVFGNDLIQTRGQGATGGGPGIVAGNNHGALKDGPFARSQPGYTGSSNGFATFETPQAGNAAQTALLRDNYIGKGFNTPAKIVQRYAPLGPENSAASVNNYIAHIAQKLGIGPDDQISEAQASHLAAAMREFETGKTASGGPRVVATRPSAAKPSQTRVVNGQAYYKVGGLWYDNPEGK